MSLYSYRSTGYVTKFDSDGNVEASYQTSPEACTCPAGHRQTCRHRQMLTWLFPIADTHWFLDWDNNHTIVDLSGVPKSHYDSFDAPAEQDTKPIDPTDIKGPSDLLTEAEFIVQVFGKDITHPPTQQPMIKTTLDALIAPIVDGPAEQDTKVDTTLIDDKPEDSFRTYLHKQGIVPKHLHPQEVHTKNPWRRL